MSIAEPANTPTQPTSADRPLRVVQYLELVRFELGGVTRAVLDMTRVMADLGHQITLLTHDAQDVPREWAERAEGEPGARAITIPRVRPGAVLPEAAERALRGADVVHLHTPWLIDNVFLATRLRKLGKPYVLTVHGMLDDWCMAQKPMKKRLFLALAGGRLLRGAAAVHFTAEAERAQSQPWCGGPRCTPIVLPLIFDTEPYEQLPGPDEARQRFGVAEGERVVLYLGRLDAKKGVEHLVRAAPSIFEKHPKAVVLLAGPDRGEYPDMLRRLIAELGLGERVRLVGPVTGELKTSLYQLADVFVLPTSQENFGFVLIESMACATPVVTTKGTDIWQELEAAGARIGTQDARAVAEGVNGVLSMPEAERRALGERGRAWTLQRFEMRTLSAEYERLYRTILAGR